MLEISDGGYCRFNASVDGKTKKDVFSWESFCLRKSWFYSMHVILKKKSNTTGKMSAFGRASACFYIPDTPGEGNSDNLGRFKISFYDFMKHSRGILT